MLGRPRLLRLLPLLALVASSAHADPEDALKPYRAGLQLFAAKAYRAAAAAFETSYARGKHPNNLYYLGEIARRQAKMRRAQQFYLRYAETLKRGKAAFLRKVEALRWELDCELVMQLRPIDAKLQLDDRPAPAPDARGVVKFKLAGGLHRLSVARAGYRTERRQLVAEFGERLELVVNLQPLPKASSRDAVALVDVHFIERVASAHLRAQGEFVGASGRSWEWILGSKRSSQNLTGVNALGLLAAYRLTGTDAYAQAALHSARALIALHAKQQRRVYAQDVEFLVAAGFLPEAARLFRRLTAPGDAVAHWQRLVATRQRGGLPTFVGWDGAAVARAALMIGRLDYAQRVLQQALSDETIWNHPSAGQRLSQASLLWALAIYRRKVKHADLKLIAFAGRLKRQLLDSQSKAGAWLTDGGAGYHTQATAYATIALAQFADSIEHARRGQRWLSSALRSAGQKDAKATLWPSAFELDGRPSGVYLPTIQSEVLQALAAGK